MANTLNTVTDTYDGQTIECAEIVSEVSTFRFMQLTAGDYAFQMIAKADTNNRTVTVVCGDKTETFSLTTSWQKYTKIFNDVSVSSQPYFQFSLSAGTFRFYHSKLEHGNKLTDWNDNPENSYKVLQETHTLALQTADKFTWIVQSGTSSSDFTLTDRTADLVAQYINLYGLVTFNGLNTAVQNDILKAISTYGTSGTAASTRDKVVVCANFTLYEGALISVKFTYTNSHTSPRLNINSTGNKSIVLNGYTIADYAESLWNAGDTVTFVYTNNTYQIIGGSALARSTDANGVIANWCYNNNTTYIDGGNIYTGTVTAEKISVTDLKALNALIGGWSIGDDGLFKTGSAYIYPDDTDVSKIRAYLLGTGTLTAQEKAWYDYNNSGDVETQDLLACKQLATGYRTIEQIMETFPNYNKPSFNILLRLNPSDPDNVIRYTCTAYGRTTTRRFGLDSAIIAGLTEDLRFRKSQAGIWASDKNDNEFAIVKYNGSNLWIGASASAGIHHDGLTVLDAGWSQENQTANRSAQVAVPDSQTSSTSYYLWHEGDLRKGKVTLGNVPASGANVASVSAPTSLVGSNPVVTATSADANCYCYIAGISTANTNTIINIGVKNTSTSALSNVVINYMIARN